MKVAMLVSLSACLLLLLPACSGPSEEIPNTLERKKAIFLPPPQHMGDVSVEEALYTRFSRRDYTGGPISIEKVAQILWAAQGKGMDGLTGASRTAPSAGATHPMELYLIAGNVEGLKPGVYLYNYSKHALTLMVEGDLREELASAALNQGFIASAPASIVLAADYHRTTTIYGERGIRYVHMEVGHITQNIYLQCETLKMGAVAVGAFGDEDVKKLLRIQESPLMIVPFGEQ